jgi:hypothetical protein
MGRLDDLQRKFGNLAARIIDLPMKKRGRTVPQLSRDLGVPPGWILAVLYALKEEGYAAVSRSGVWTLRFEDE